MGTNRIKDVESNDFQEIIDHFIKPQSDFKIGDWVIFSEKMPPQKIIGFDLVGDFKTQRIDGLKTTWFKTCAERKATNEEVREAFINEAKKRGVWDTVNILPLNRSGVDKKGYFIEEYGFGEDQLWSKYGVVYEKGKWATPIETITKEEADKQ